MTHSDAASGMMMEESAWEMTNMQPASHAGAAISLKLFSLHKEEIEIRVKCVLISLSNIYTKIYMEPMGDIHLLLVNKMNSWIPVHLIIV